MSLRIRKSGEILCAAHTEAKEGDTYLNDEIHYYLSVLTDAIVASENHSEDNLWFWNIKEGEKPHYEETETKFIKVPVVERLPEHGRRVIANVLEYTDLGISKYLWSVSYNDFDKSFHADHLDGSVPVEYWLEEVPEKQ